MTRQKRSNRFFCRKCIYSFLLLMVCQFLFVSHIFAQEIKAVQVGSVSIKIPTPTGFVEACTNDPAFTTYMESDIPPTNKILTCYLSDEDFRNKEMGTRAVLQNYLGVQVNTEFVDKPISFAEFKALRKYHKDTQGSFVGLKKLENIAKKLKEGSVGPHMSLGIFQDEYDKISQADLDINLAASSATQRNIQLSTSAIQVLKNRIVFFYVFTTYNEVSDYANAIEFTKKWITSLRNMNK